MPYFIAVYDINVKRGSKMLKLFRRYLTWVQNSVVEGEMTQAQFQELQAQARALMRIALPVKTMQVKFLVLMVSPPQS